MAELILTIPGSRAGAIAIDHLAEHGREVGCEYRYSLSRYLEGLNAAAYLQSLPFTFHLVRTEDGREAAAMNRILRWHSGEVRDWPHGRVDGVEPNLPLYPLAPLGLPFQRGGQDSTYQSLMRVNDAHHQGVRGAGVRVAILDTGLHQAASLKPQDFFDVEDTSNLHPVPPAPVDYDGHGTAMADLIHAVAPDAEIYVVRVLDTGALNLWNLLAGVAVAVTDCAADVVNISLGFSSLLS
jgi:subtilisin family serine protease